jgi:hypothetical protein
VPQPPRVRHLDEFEPVPGPDTLTWLPVRHTLGIRAFGCNAYTAQTAGVDVVEPHTEDPVLAHEELYFVASGRATFTIDEETYDAPAGTNVFIPDPASHRHAVAAEAGTTVLSFGGPPIFEPSAWEWTFRADPLMHSDPAAARAILEDGLRAHPESPSLRYAVARLELLDGHRDAAIAALVEALRRRPEIRAWLEEDEELAGLRDVPAVAAALGGS